MQSTYDDSGQDQGWGDESVYCFTKHFAGAGAIEGGRNDHAYAGRYAVFPGDNFGANIITFFDGAFSLPGLTKSSGIMTEYAVNVDGKGDGTLIDIDCLGVENEVARNMYERSELAWLLRHDPIGSADLVLNGCIRFYLDKTTTCRPLDEKK